MGASRHEKGHRAAGALLLVLSLAAATGAAAIAWDTDAPAEAAATSWTATPSGGGSSSLATLVDGRLAWPALDPTALVPDERARRGTQLLDCPPWEILDTEPRPYREFHFSRGYYSSDPFSRRGGGGSWRVDFNKADRQFLVVIDRILDLDLHPCENVVYLDDPHFRRFPWVYMLEVGSMGLTQREVDGFRDYLLAGGFAFIDDFWGTYEWAVFEQEISRVLPEYPIVEMPMDHLLFRIVYPIDEVLQVPAVNNTRGGPAYYYENDGYVPHLRGIFDDDGRLMVLISWNSDLGDAWEWAEDPNYPWDRSNYAFQLAFNVIVYAMTH